MHQNQAQELSLCKPNPFFNKTANLTLTPQPTIVHFKSYGHQFSQQKATFSLSHQQFIHKEQTPGLMVTCEIGPPQPNTTENSQTLSSPQVHLAPLILATWKQV